MGEPQRRLLVLGAHPDDAEYLAGGVMSRYRALGGTVHIVSLTDGGSGHYCRPVEELIRLRRDEASASAAVIGATYEVWDVRDGELMPSLEVRRRVIAEMRRFRPDLVLTHRTNDYHPDHRATGHLVLDASYLVTVPNVLPEVPALRRAPVVAYMADLFTTPVPLLPDVLYDSAEQVDTIVAMLGCHRTQVFEWLPYQEGNLETIPGNHADRRAWLREWFRRHVRARADRFRADLLEAYGPERGSRVEFCEVFQLSEHAAAADLPLRQQLFPGGVCRPPRAAPAVPVQFAASDEPRA